MIAAALIAVALALCCVGAFFGWIDSQQPYTAWMVKDDDET